MSNRGDDTMVQPTVLVVEDDRDTRDFFVDLLTYEGFRVLTAATGRAGLDHLAGQHVDVVVLDLRLPDMDGYTVCRAIRASDQSAAPIIVVSANRAADSEEKARVAGATEYLAKPFELRMLTELLRSLVGPANQ